MLLIIDRVFLNVLASFMYCEVPLLTTLSIGFMGLYTFSNGG